MKENESKLIIGYFNIRGKAQVPRLLCQYLNVPYENQFITPKGFIEEKKKNPNFIVPFIKDKTSTINGPEQMCFYIISKCFKQQMIGRTQEDKVKVKMYCWSIDSFASIIGTYANKKLSENQSTKLWDKNIKLKLQKYEKACTPKSQWFLGYLTLIDFSIYELVRYMQWMFPGKTKQFQNLYQIKQRFSMLPQIKAYQISSQCVAQISPQKILLQLQEATGGNGKKK